MKFDISEISKDGLVEVTVTLPARQLASEPIEYVYLSDVVKYTEQASGHKVKFTYFGTNVSNSLGPARAKWKFLLDVPSKGKVTTRKAKPAASLTSKEELQVATLTTEMESTPTTTTADGNGSSEATKTTTRTTRRRTRTKKTTSTN